MSRICGASQLARGASKDVAPQYRCDGAPAFLSNRNPRDGKPKESDEKRQQVWLLPAEGGEPLPLSDEPLGVSAFRFAQRQPELFVIADVLPGVAQGDQRQRAAELEKRGPSALHFDRIAAGSCHSRGSGCTPRGLRIIPDACSPTGSRGPRRVAGRRMVAVCW
ncbi:MAG TPA: hypothetical protein VFS67_25080 [Polyangiaceae bacterium]|jgi:hypothetical protein|nr:hypothetical protein [Polyangiaceae bacterium]